VTREQGAQPPNEPVETASNGRVHRDRAAPPQRRGEETVHEDEQSRSESDQTLADSDQTLSDADQTSAERDQASADSDQLAADQDQVASDREFAAGGSPGVHDAGRDVRQRTTRSREQVAGRREETAQRRLDVADQRDVVAHTRDLAGLARDQAAATRDLAMAQLDTADEHAAGARAHTGTEIVMRAAEQRRRSAQYREKAAEHRTLAAGDRQVAARDRAQAASERNDALADREALALALATAATDGLTGARTRAAGLADLEREVERCRRTSERLVVVYVDAVGLKIVNDTEGHAAGDELIKLTVALMSDRLRSYDLIIRVGGDEFVCAMSRMTMDEARSRFSDIAGALASTPQRGSIRTGFAELAPDETATEVIARADKELLNAREVPPVRG
jgi:diguanylate cyclase (GGDEF)-like protein